MPAARGSSDKYVLQTFRLRNGRSAKRDSGQATLIQRDGSARSISTGSDSFQPSSENATFEPLPIERSGDNACRPALLRRTCKLQLWRRRSRPSTGLQREFRIAAPVGIRLSMFLILNDITLLKSGNIHI